MSNIYFLTHKMFCKPSYDEYQKELDVFLKKIYSASSQSSINRCKQICSLFEAHIPELDKILYREFVRNRENVGSGRYILSVDEFILFMENFHFLLTTNDIRFRLASHQKQKILQFLRETYSSPVCEPGVVTRFNDLLFEFRSDTSWISSEVTKYRYHMIQMMASEYDELHHTQTSLRIHTLMHMNQLANEQNLGVNPLAMIHDAYLDVASTEDISDYFHLNFEKKLKIYEKNFIDGLMSHLWSSFSRDFYPKLSKSAHEKVMFNYQFLECKSIKCANTVLFETFLEAYLGAEVSTAGFYEALDETGNSYELVDESQFKLVLKKALFEKLELEGFIIPLEKISKVNIQQVRLIGDNKELTKDFILKISNQQDFYQNFRSYLQSYKSILFNYPETLVQILLTNVTMWDCLPFDFKNNTLFIKQLIAELNKNDEPIFFELASEILKINPEFFHQFSMAKRDILRSHFNLMYPYEVQNYCDEAGLKGRNINPCLLILSKNIKSISNKKQISIEELATHINLFTPRQLLGYLKNNQVKVQGISLKALEYFDQALESSNTQYHQTWANDGYLKFRTHLAEPQVVEHQPAVYSLDFYKLQVKKSIHKNCNWLNALIEFQQHTPVSDILFDEINSFKQHMKFLLDLGIQLLNILYKFTKKIGGMIYTGVIAAVIYDIGNFLDGLVYGISCHMYTQWFQIFALIAIAQMIKNTINFASLKLIDKVYLFIQLFSCLLLPYVPSLFIVINAITLLKETLILVVVNISNFLSKPLTDNDVEIYFFYALGYYMQSIENFSRSVGYFFNFVYEEFLVNLPMIFFAAVHTTIVRAYSTLTEKYNSVNDFQSATQSIEANIWRLESIDDISAQQKAKLLKQVWSAINQELQDDHTMDFKNALTKSCKVSFKGQDYQLSFYQISGLKRTNGLELNLKHVTCQHTFFSSSSPQILDGLRLDSKPLMCA